MKEQIKNIIESYCEGINHLEFNIADLDKMADEILALQLPQTGVISRSYSVKEVKELFIKLENERAKYYPEDANDIIPLDRFFLENGL